VFGTLLAGILIACGSASDATDDVAEAPPAPTATRAAAAFVAPPPDVVPIRFPEDEAPHDMLTEWWYYTGHLAAADGARYGFQFVIFQSLRGDFPPVYAAHLAITDNARGRFHYAERSGHDAVQPAEHGFALDLDGWRMSGVLGHDRVAAAMDGYALDLELTATKPAALHHETGYIDFQPAGGSYYYSRTRMAASGTLTVDGRPLAVTGQAWMDHQWGNFIVAGAGGWDWFALQLDDGWDLMIFHIRTAEGQVALSFGTLVAPDGRTRHLGPDDFAFAATGEWTSPVTDTTYPSGWAVDLPAEDWSLTLEPSLADQELRTAASTGVIYWEGEVVVSGTVAGRPVTGLGYVELTGYADDAISRPAP
jgi:predicted secreted hydrolase